MVVQTGANRYVVLFILSLVYMLNYVDRQIIAILAQPIKQDLNLTDTELGFLSGFAFALVYTLLGVPIAWLADRGRRVRIVAVACAVWSVFTMLCGAAGSFTSLALARAGVGIGESGGVPPSHSLIADYFPPEKRGFAIALHSLGLPLGAMLGLSLGGGVAAIYGWRAAFLAVGTPGILAAIALTVIAREPARGGTDEQIALSTAKPSLLACWRTFQSSPVLSLLLVAAAAYSFVFTGFASWAPSMLMRAKGMSLGEVAAYYSLVSGGATALGMLVSGVVTARFGRNERAHLLIPAWAMVAGLPFFVFGLLASAWTTALACLAIPITTSSMYLAPATALVQNNVPPNQRSAAAAILLLVLNLFGTGLGPLFVGVMSETLTPNFGEQALIYAML